MNNWFFFSLFLHLSLRKKKNPNIVGVKYALWKTWDPKHNFNGRVCDKWARGTINKWNTKSSRPPGRCVNSRGYGTFVSMPRPITCQRRLSLLLSFQTMPALVRSLTGHRQHFHPFRVVFFKSTAFYLSPSLRPDLWECLTALSAKCGCQSSGRSRWMKWAKLKNWRQGRCCFYKQDFIRIQAVKLGWKQSLL